MKYFCYSVGGKNSSQYQMTRIFNAVRKMTSLAKSRYGGRYQDALDAALFHIIENYNPDVMDGSDEALEHYTASIVNTIYRSNSRREVSSDLLVTIEQGNQSKKETFEGITDPISKVEINQDVVFEQEVGECINELVPKFLKDYELFMGNRSYERKESYGEIYDKYSDKVINESVKRLRGDYDKIKHLSALSKSCRLKAFSPDRYKESADDFIKFTGMINGIAVCTYASARVKRNVYKVHMQEFVDEVLDRYYTCEDAIAHRVIGGHDIYCSLSGKFVDNIEELKLLIEYDIVGSLLAKLVNLRVVEYKAGEIFLVSSLKPEEYGLVFTLFGSDCVLQLSRLIVRRVVSSEC